MTFDDRFDTEAQFHLDMQIQKNIQSGMSPDEARRAALVQFGGRERYREDARDETRSRAWEDVGRDLRASLRTMRRHPAFSVATIVTMALGIAATASIFSITDAFLFRALPFKDSDRIVMIGDVQGANSWYPASYLEFTDWRSMSRDASAVVATIGSGMTWAASGGAERVRAARGSDGYFDLLGVRPIMGRAFAREDHAEGAARVVVLSRACWTQRFTASRDCIGKQPTLSRNSCTSVGIVGSGRELGWEGTMLSTPLEPHAPWKERGTHYLSVLGRWRDGTTLASVG